MIGWGYFASLAGTFANVAKWQHAEGRWHAIDDRVRADPATTFRTYCGAWVSTGEDDYPILGGGQFGEICADCLAVTSEILARAHRR